MLINNFSLQSEGIWHEQVLGTELLLSGVEGAKPIPYLLDPVVSVLCNVQSTHSSVLLVRSLSGL